MYCPECGVEYRAGFTECADCHVPLVEKLPDPERQQTFALVADLLVILQPDVDIHIFRMILANVEQRLADFGGKQRCSHGGHHIKSVVTGLVTTSRVYPTCGT